MIDTYTDWLGDFIDEEPKIAVYDGERLRDRFQGLHYAYAYHRIGSSTFGYNTKLMNDLDEIDVISIAAHEAGHYWSFEGDYSWLVQVGFFYSGIGLLFAALWAVLELPAEIFFFQFLVSFGAFYLSFDCMQMSIPSNEARADNFVRKILSPAICLNMLTTLIVDESTEQMYLSSYTADQIKITLKELEIDYESNIET